MDIFLIFLGWESDWAVLLLSMPSRCPSGGTRSRTTRTATSTNPRANCPSHSCSWQETRPRLDFTFYGLYMFNKIHSRGRGGGGAFLICCNVGMPSTYVPALARRRSRQTCRVANPIFFMNFISNRKATCALSTFELQYALGGLLVTYLFVRRDKMLNDAVRGTSTMFLYALLRFGMICCYLFEIHQSSVRLQKH